MSHLSPPCPLHRPQKPTRSRRVPVLRDPTLSLPPHRTQTCSLQPPLPKTATSSPRPQNSISACSPGAEPGDAPHPCCASQLLNDSRAGGPQWRGTSTDLCVWGEGPHALSLPPPPPHPFPRRQSTAQSGGGPAGAAWYLPGSRSGCEVRGEPGAGPGPVAGFWEALRESRAPPRRRRRRRRVSLLLRRVSDFPLASLPPSPPPLSTPSHAHAHPSSKWAAWRACVCVCGCVCVWVCVSQPSLTPTAAAPGAGHSPGHREVFGEAFCSVKSSSAHPRTRQQHAHCAEIGHTRTLHSWHFPLVHRPCLLLQDPLCVCNRSISP